MGAGASAQEDVSSRRVLRSYSRSTLAYDLLQEAVKQEDEGGKSTNKSKLPFKISVSRPGSAKRRGTHTGGSLLHRDAASSDLDRLSRFFKELLSDPGLRGCFRDYLCREHLAEHMILAWIDMEQLKRACDRFIRCAKGMGTGSVRSGATPQNGVSVEELRALFEDTACKCDDMFKKYLADGAGHSIAVSVEAETRADVGGSIQHLFKVVEKAYAVPPVETKPHHRISLGVSSASSAATDRMEQTAAIRGVRKYVSAAQTKVFTTMLFDYLPGFITSEQSSNSKSAITSGADVRGILVKGLQAARLHTSMGAPLSPCNGKGGEEGKGGAPEMPDAVVASMQLHQIVADPTCSMFLESYLNRVADKIKAAGEAVTIPATAGGPAAPVLSLGFTPDLIIACLLEIDDLKRSEDKYHLAHRANLILQRYGADELGCPEMMALRGSRTKGDPPPDASTFDLVYVLLSTRLLMEHGEGFMASPEFKDLERVLSSQQSACMVVDTAAKVGTIRGYVLEKLGVKEETDPSKTLEARAAAAAQDAEELLKTLEGVLSLALGRSLFKRFSIQQFQEENVNFYLEVMHYKNEQYLVPPDGSVIFADRSNLAQTGGQKVEVDPLSDPHAEMELCEMRRLRAEHICAKYIEVGSRRQINISSAMRNAILNVVRRRGPASPSGGGSGCAITSSPGGAPVTATPATAVTAAAVGAAKDGPGAGSDDEPEPGVAAAAAAAAAAPGRWSPPLNVFNAAQREVLHLMKLNLWLKFQASPLYQSLNRQVRKRAAISVMVKAGQISDALLQGQRQDANMKAAAAAGKRA